MLATAALMLALTGCSAATGSHHDAGLVAEQFASALSEEDLETVCSLLATGTLATLEEESGSPCVDAIGTLDLPAGGAVRATHAYARAAESILGSDVIFLTLEPSGWKVRAAGCTARPDLPYQCTLKGE